MLKDKPQRRNGRKAIKNLEHGVCLMFDKTFYKGFAATRLNLYFIGFYKGLATTLPKKRNKLFNYEF